MKILTFHHNLSFPSVMNALKAKISTPKAQHYWHTYEDISTICLPVNLFEKHKSYLMNFTPTVEENVTVSVHAAETDDIPWGVSYLGGDRLWKNGKGAGVRIAVIDTGISRKHFELRERVKGGVRIAGGGSNGHGTHVAGIIASSLNHRGIVGVSPEAELYDVKAFDANGKASLTNILRGIDWSIKNKMQVINMSFGMPQPSEALQRMIQRAAANNIVMVASAGNNGKAVEYPARYSQVIAVGALDEKGKLADFSSRGAGMNQTAPGVDILSTWPGNRFKKLSGTSMAAPHVSGMVALRLASRNRSTQTKRAAK